MNDIFKDMQAKVGCEYISDLPSYKRKVWQEMKRLNPAINVNIKMYIFDHLRMYIFAILPLDRYIFLSDKIFL